ncbi:HNH endonuclease [Longimicrobium sp.]|uniref:HNH endonuclease n=1 Tax=Longimicrobium sp. TaxID=2029185 RepID=UPI0039C9AE62
MAEGVIHVHHLHPLSEVGEAHLLDPVEDLRPVCANCHVVLHLRKEVFKIEDVREFLQQRTSS